MISRFYQKDSERCRLFARRLNDIMPAEHPGCLHVTLQPIERGMVMAEHGIDLGWFAPEAVESYHGYLVEHGWECTGSRLYAPGCRECASRETKTKTKTNPNPTR